MDYLEQALRALAPTPLSQPARLETIGLLNGLVTLFARTELRRRSSPTDPQLVRTSYLTTAATEEHHPFITAALAGSPGAEAEQDTHTLFERMVRRVLAGLIDLLWRGGRERSGGAHLCNILRSPAAKTPLPSAVKTTESTVPSCPLRAVRLPRCPQAEVHTCASRELASILES